MIEKQKADEKIKEGWLRAWLMFEVLAINGSAAKQSLESLINKLERDDRVKLYKKDFSEIKKVEKPMKNISEAFSQVCETEFVCKDFDSLVQIAIEYGPSAIEILEPEKIVLRLDSAQGILNSVAELMHKFAAAGFGGLLVVRGE